MIPFSISVVYLWTYYCLKLCILLHIIFFCFNGKIFTTYYLLIRFPNISEQIFFFQFSMLIYCLQMTVEKKINYGINNSFVNAVLQWLACLFYCCPLTVNHFIVSHVMVLSCCRKYFTVSLAIFSEKKAVI